MALRLVLDALSAPAIAAWNGACRGSCQTCRPFNCVRRTVLPYRWLVLDPTAATPALLLCAEVALRDSLTDLLASDGRPSTAEPLQDSERHSLVLATSDAWPSGWNFVRLRSTFSRVPCVVLSGSPLGGHFAVTQLARGYFLQLPALPGQILDLVAQLSDV
jgi:hypothetical protein